jgi:hypothetical protein
MLNICLEYKLADMWVGVFWRSGETCMPQGAPSFSLPICKLVEVWICLVPCFPIHIQWVDSRPIKESQVHFAQKLKERQIQSKPASV